MRIRSQLLVALLTLAACTAQPSEPRVQLPMFFYGNFDNDIGAINQSGWALSSPVNTRDDPAEALRAVISVEYLASELNTSPRWFRMSPLIKLQMVQARDEVRQALGIAPNAAPQAVINALLAVLQDGWYGNMDHARQVLASPTFTRPPDETLRLLANLPPLPTARAATGSAEYAELTPRR